MHISTIPARPSCSPQWELSWLVALGSPSVRRGRGIKEAPLREWKTENCLTCVEKKPYEILLDGDIQRALKLLLRVHGGLIARGRASLTNPVVLESTAEKVYAKYWEVQVVKEASKEPRLEDLPTCDMDHA